MPYEKAALTPYMSELTLDFHHGKHLGTYTNTLNDLIAGSEYAALPLQEIIVRSSDATDEKTQKIFNNAAQVFNHNFFFHCMRPHGGGQIPDQITSHFGGAEQFRTQFKIAATGLFGSGWAWIARDDTGKLTIMQGKNADTPIAHGMQPILALDVWEHAYYLDYQNRRADFVDVFLDHLVNWDFVLENMAI